MNPAMQETIPQTDATRPSLLVQIYRLSLEPDALRLWMLVEVPRESGGDAVRMEVATNGVSIPLENRGTIENGAKRTVEEATTYSVFTRIPLGASKRYRVDFGFEVDGVVLAPVIRFAPHVPIQKMVDHSYWNRNGWILRRDGKGLDIRRASFVPLAMAEWRRERSMLFAHEVSLLLWRWVRFLTRPFIPKNIWLLSDRLERADDNAEAFFTWLRAHRREVACRPVFVLSKKSPHWDRLRKIGPVVNTHGRLHKLLFLHASHLVMAYERPVYSNPFYNYERRISDMTAEQRRIYLGHGIIKGDMTKPLGQFRKDFRLLITSTQEEFDAFLNTKGYGFEPRELALTGRPRYDFLEDRAKKIVTVAPSWRHELFVKPEGDASPDLYLELIPEFEESEFCRFWRGLLLSPRLMEVAQRLGYRFQFLPHPRFSQYLHRFGLGDKVTVLGAGTRYREVFAESALLLTDWSSTAFDFAYMKKPVVYAQFDASRNYPEGYFDDEKIGFGEVETTLDAAIDRVIEYMENGCRMKEKYRARVDRFFTFTDRDNSRRVYEAVIDRG